MNNLIIKRRLKVNNNKKVKSMNNKLKNKKNCKQKKKQKKNKKMIIQKAMVKVLKIWHLKIVWKLWDNNKSQLLWTTNLQLTMMNQVCL